MTEASVHATDVPAVGLVEDAMQRGALEYDDGAIPFIHWAGPPAAPPVVFGHATGMNAHTYRSFLACLSDFTAVYAPDHRGHGRNALAAGFQFDNWDHYVRDMIAFIDRTQDTPVCYCGHSLGAMVGILAAARRPDLIASLVLFDPVLFSPRTYLLIRSPLWAYYKHKISIASAAARRRAHWPDRDSVFAAYRGRGLFADLAEVVLDDYLEDGLRVSGDGTVLACEPAWEAMTFRAQRNPIWSALRKLAAKPLVVVRAAKRSTLRITEDRLRRAVPGARVIEMPATGHFGLLERPQDAALYVGAVVLGGQSHTPPRARSASDDVALI